MPVNSSPNVFALCITLPDHRPEIWRRVLVPGSLRLDKLHMVFQEAMVWTNSHLHQFRIGDALYGMHFEDWPDEELHEVDFTLADVARAADRFHYDYDFGDGWEHEVLANPAHEEHQKYRRWAGEDFNPEAFDLAATNAALQRLR